MDRAIYLYDESGAVAVEIHDETVYDLLTPEMPAIKLIASDSCPQERFWDRHCVP